jgi:hypothetical protein
LPAFAGAEPQTAETERVLREQDRLERRLARD